MKLFQEEYINNLPDCYNKSKTSNNYKLLELFKYSIDGFRHNIKQIEDILYLDNARGATLDLYGELVGQNRGLATDEQYIFLIKTRIMRNLANGSNKSIVDALCSILNCNVTDVHIEDAESPCTVKISNLPLKTVIEADLTTNQLTQIIQSLMPIGVTFEPVTYDGTFEISDIENEYDDTAGFCDVEGGTIGGYLGTLSSDTHETVLPI